MIHRSGISPVLVVLFFGCDLFMSNDGPLGQSTMSATINGNQVVFSNIYGNDYQSIHLYGTSQGYFIAIDLTSNPGFSKWGQSGPTPMAWINSNQCDTSGGLTITNFNQGRRLIEGQFQFHSAVIIGPNDTLKFEVSNGVFTHYYSKSGD